MINTLTNTIGATILQSGVAYDVDAQAFFTAASITDGTQKSAINTLVGALKDASIWTKFSAIYPIVGGTAATHKWNLKNPLDTDVGFRLSFVNGATHASTGVTFNGTTQYANTFLDQSITSPITLNSAHLSLYVRTEGAAGNYDMGAEGQSAGVTRIIINVGGTMYGGINDNGDAVTTSPATRKGMYVSTRTASTGYKVFRNEVLFFNKTSTSTALTVTNKILIGAQSFSNEVIAGYSSKEFAFASIGGGLSDAEALALYNAVNTYQTTLGRNV